MVLMDNFVRSKDLQLECQVKVSKLQFAQAKVKIIVIYNHCEHQCSHVIVIHWNRNN